MPINPTTLKALIDTQITNETVDFAITPAEVGGRMKDAIDYTTEQVASKQDTLISNTNIKTVNGSTLLGSGDLIISGGASKTSGAITLTGTFQVLPYDINSCSFSGGKAYLPTTTENGKEILVITTSNNIEIRANSAGTNFMFENFGTFTSSVTLKTNNTYRFTFIGFGGYWKAELLENIGYTTYSALIYQSGTGVPIAKTLKNTTGVTFSYTRSSAGIYMITGSSNVFTTDKTATLYSLNTSGAFPNGNMFFYSLGGQYFQIETRSSGTLFDEIIQDTFIEIRIYS